VTPASPPTRSSEIGQVAYLGVSEGSDPIRRVVAETQISRVFHTGRRNRVICNIATPVPWGDCSDLDLVGNTDRQQPHQLSAADIGDKRDPGETQQAGRVGGGQSRAVEFLFDEVEIMVRRTGLPRFVRFRVLPLAGRTKAGVVTRASEQRVGFTMRRRLIVLVRRVRVLASGREKRFGSHLRTSQVCR